MSRLVVLGAFVVLLFPALMSVSSVSAELSEAEKQALEQAREAEKQAAENQGNQPAPEPPQAPEPAPPVEAPEAPEPAPPPEAPEAPEPAPPPEPPQAPEAPEPAPPPEPPQGEQDQGGNQAATDRLNGYISAIGSDFLTVGIIGDNTVTVTSRTYITYNGQISNLPRLFIGDTVSVQFDSATNEAIRIEVEGYGRSAIYQGVGVEVTYIGLIGHIPGRSWGMHAGGAGLKLGAATQVTVNGVPAAYLDLQVGDTIDYVMSAVDLKALWIIVTR